MAEIRRVFTGGNTSSSFYSFHDNIIGDNRNMLYIIKGTPGGGKSSLMADIGDRFIKQGFNIEYHHCPSDPGSIDGLVINKLKIGIVDGTPPHSMDPIYPGLKDKIINLGRFIDEGQLKGSKEKIVNAKLQNKLAYKKAFKYFKAAKYVYELVEESNSIYADTNRINKKGLELMAKIFEKKAVAGEDSGFSVRHLFSNAYTPEGFIDYTETILSQIGSVYYIRADMGNGEQGILNTIIELSRLKNYKLELFHNSLIPNLIESVFIKDLNTIVTLNDIGVRFTDDILDIKKYLDDDKLEKDAYNAFKILVNKGMEALQDAKANHSVLESSYRMAINFSEIDKVKEELYNEILDYIY